METTTQGFVTEQGGSSVSMSQTHWIPKQSIFIASGIHLKITDKIIYSLCMFLETSNFMWSRKTTANSSVAAFPEKSRNQIEKGI